MLFFSYQKSFHSSDYYIDAGFVADRNLILALREKFNAPVKMFYVKNFWKKHKFTYFKNAAFGNIAYSTDYGKFMPFISPNRSVIASNGLNW